VGRFFSAEVPFWFGPRQLNQPVGAASTLEWPIRKPKRLNTTGIFSFILHHCFQPQTTTILAANDARGNRAIIGFQEQAQYYTFRPVMQQE
jgi:hypothetical protein